MLTQKLSEEMPNENSRKSMRTIVENVANKMMSVTAAQAGPSSPLQLKTPTAIKKYVEVVTKRAQVEHGQAPVLEEVKHPGCRSCMLKINDCIS